MHIKLKNGQYWVWSSKKASLDCMPWFKLNSLDDLPSKLKPKITMANNVFENNLKMKNERLYSWAKNLN